MSVFQNAVMALVNHPGRPFSMSFLESRPLCLSGKRKSACKIFFNIDMDSSSSSTPSHCHSPVGLSFLLCIVCIAETFPILNKFLQLAPFPSKASKVALLRLLVSNVSLNYFAEYISTFLFRRDVWMARNKVNNLQQQQVIMHAADQEDILLAEERAANVSIVYVMFVFGCSLLLPQLIL